MSQFLNIILLRYFFFGAQSKLFLQSKAIITKLMHINSRLLPNAQNIIFLLLVLPEALLSSSSTRPPSVSCLLYTGPSYKNCNDEYTPYCCLYHPKLCLEEIIYYDSLYLRLVHTLSFRLPNKSWSSAHY